MPTYTLYRASALSNVSDVYLASCAYISSRFAEQKEACHCEVLISALLIVFVCRLFSLLDTSTADVLGLFYVRLWELPIVVAMACAIGALGSLFVALNSHLVYVLRKRFIPPTSRFRCFSSSAAVPTSVWIFVCQQAPLQGASHDQICSKVLLLQNCLSSFAKPAAQLLA